MRHLVKVGKTNPNKPKVKIGKMNVTSLKTMNYEQRAMNDEKNKPKQTQATIPVRSWLLNIQKNLKNIDFLLDKNKNNLNIVKDEQCFLKIILYKDS